jgi:dienelactone hydrolase
MTRRHLVGAALAVGAGLPLIGAGRASAAPVAGGPARLILPAPTGPYPVGTVSLHLADRSRPDPAAGPGRFRELMAGVWYPARDVSRHPLAPWTSPAVLRELLTSAGFAADAVLAPMTAGHRGAPVRRGTERLPVVVFSHGAHDHRADNTIVVQELASHGYLVLTVDHTYDAFSEFPDGRVVVPVDDPILGARDFARDLRFVLDTVEQLAAGCNPDAARRALPAGLAGAPDPHRIGVFGWSKGATAAGLVMSEDRRVRAGLGFDGPMQPAIATELHRPFMLMTAAFTREAEPSVAEFWSRLRGWRLNVQAEGAVHSSYTDYQALYPQLAKVVGMSDEQLGRLIGTLDPARAVRIQQSYPLAFFDLHLRRRRGHLLDGPSPAFPEVTFIR